MWDASIHVYFTIFTCSVAILLATPSHIPPALDRLISLPPLCGPARVLSGGVAASVAAQMPRLARLGATRGVGRGAIFGFDHHLLDLGAEPRLHFIRDGLQYSRLFDRDNFPKTLDYCGLDSLRVFRG